MVWVLFAAFKVPEMGISNREESGDREAEFHVARA
jgi:hypothetical protein